MGRRGASVPAYKSERTAWSICMSSTGAPLTSTNATATPWLGGRDADVVELHRFRPE
jgi:hypothetical protein